MTNNRKPRTTYPKQLKPEAIGLMNESSRPSAAIATELGIRRNQRYKWKEQLETKGDEALTLACRLCGQG